MRPLKVFIGYDPAEIEAYRVAEYSLLRHASIPVSVTPLDADVLRMHGLLTRPVDSRNGHYDLMSNAPASTEFAVSRFLTPILAQSGMALFVDCDVVFLDDIAKLLDEANPDYAVQCVHHGYQPSTTVKMIDKPQTRYPYKNWSSVMLFHCDHPGNKRLSVDMINRWPGRALHAFQWLDIIGSLSPGWNWLVGEQPKPDPVHIAHFTLGGPWLGAWSAGQHDELWMAEHERMVKG